jgi:phage shock protein A
MTTFISKLRTLTLGTAHDLLSKAIDLNSPTMVRQYVRDLEDAIGKLKAEAATEDGSIRTVTRQRQDLDVKIKADKETIAKLIANGSQDLARGKAAVTVQDQKRSDSLAQSIQDQQASLAKLTSTISNIEQKHELMSSRVRELERLDRDSKAKEQASKAINSVASLVNSGADISIDDVAEKMRSRNDVANAKFDQAIGGIPTPEDHSEDVDALLNSLTPVTK